MIPIPRLRFAHLPTPVDPLPLLSELLAGPILLVKRDDLTGLAMGGNKTRKLEYLLAEAQANGAKTLITAGAIHSNHCRQTAAAAARFGFKCILVLTGDKPSVFSGNLLLDRLFNAEIVWAQHDAREMVLQDTFRQAWSEARRPYLIPYGGSNPLGATAYVFALDELLNQGIHPDWIVFASSSGGTQAGLILGAKLFGYQGQILGISVDEPSEILETRVFDLAKATADYLGESINISKSDININSNYTGDGYGIMGEREQEAIQLFARSEGLLLDPVYTGRAAAGLVDLIKKGFFKPKSTVLFWHTGGLPTLFANGYYQELLLFD